VGSRRMERNEHGVRRLNLNASLRVILELNLCDILQTKRDRMEPVHCIFVRDILSRAYIEFHDKKQTVLWGVDTMRSCQSKCAVYQYQVDSRDLFPRRPDPGSSHPAPHAPVYPESAGHDL